VVLPVPQAGPYPRQLGSLRAGIARFPGANAPASQAGRMARARRVEGPRDNHPLAFGERVTAYLLYNGSVSWSGEQA
jgi:hypothetical protein